MSNPPPPTEILPAAAEHLPAIAALAGVIWRQYYPAIISPAQIDYMLETMYDLPTLRAELLSGIRFDRLLRAETLVGFASYGPTPDSAVFKLHRLYLHPDCHGCGLGTQLIRHCESEIRRLGARQLILNVNKQNAKAIAVYQRNGFRIAESVTIEIGSGFVMDDYVMARDLA